MLQAKSAMSLVLKPGVAQHAAAALVAPTTAKKYEVVEDEHAKREDKLLIADRLLCYQMDSSKANDTEWHAEIISTYHAETDAVYRTLAAVRAIEGTKGADILGAFAATIAEYSIKPQQITHIASDTCSSITGQNSSDVAQSKGMVERVRQTTDNELEKHAPCFSHGVDLSLRAGTLAMTGKDPDWFAHHIPETASVTAEFCAGIGKAQAISCHSRSSTSHRQCALTEIQSWERCRSWWRAAS